MSDENKSPFTILKEDQGPTVKSVTEDSTDGEMKDRVERLIQSSKVFLFMKGTPEMPQCGFSANVIGILNHFGVSYNTFNVLADTDIRQGIKDYANWPTIPQLYIDGKFIGGNDILMEMHEDGELETLFK